MYYSLHIQTITLILATPPVTLMTDQEGGCLHEGDIHHLIGRNNKQTSRGGLTIITSNAVFRSESQFHIEHITGTTLCMAFNNLFL